jgi:hypothetical protein
MARKHIFISYRSLEFDHAYKIAKSLTDHGYFIWMDCLNGILPGDNWRDQIQAAVNEAFAMVSVLSRNYVESEWCKREYQRADTLKVPVFLARIGEVESEKMPIELQSIQHVDFIGVDDKTFDEKILKLIAGIKNKTDIESVNNISFPKDIKPNPYRDDVEDQVEKCIETAEIVENGSSFDAIEAAEIKKDLEALKAQYAAVSNQYRLTIDALIVTKLKGQKNMLKENYQELEQQLRSLDEK